jgi:hypothetical protein
MRHILGASLALALIAGAGLEPLAAQQLGAATKSPPPDGVQEGQGAAYPKGRYAELDKLPDWGGVWFLTFQGRVPGAKPEPGPQLKGEYLKKHDAMVAEAKANNGVTKRERSYCSPPGMPGIMRLAQYPYEFIFAPGRVTINQEAWMQTRTIWTDGRKHQEDPDPTYMGDSIGHWEGDTLVVDTIGIDPALEIVAGSGHSDKFHLVERIHLDPANPDMLVNEMTMEDPEALAEPYHTTARYRRDRYGGLLEFECSQNDRNPVDANGNTEFN